MTEGDIAYLTPEARARVQIDRMLSAAGWIVQDYARVNLSEARGVAVREFVLKPPHGRADYLLFVDGEAVGVAEAKKEGETLTGVAWQTAAVGPLIEGPVIAVSVVDPTLDEADSPAAADKAVAIGGEDVVGSCWGKFPTRAAPAGSILTASDFLDQVEQAFEYTLATVEHFRDVGYLRDVL
jgi:hypothetical protein